MIPELIPLDSRAIDFLKEELRASPTLGRQLHELDLAKGTMVALVPTPKAGAIHDFRASIHDYPRTSIQAGLQQVVSVENALLALARSYFRSSSNGILLCESFLLRPADLLIVHDLPTSTFAHGDAVFSTATIESSDGEARGVAQWLFLAPYGLGLLAELPDGTSTSEGLVERAARHVDAVLLGAYDGEGVLIWARRAVVDRLSAT